MDLEELRNTAIASREIIKKRHNTLYTCTVCGKEGVTYSECQNYSYYRMNDGLAISIPPSKMLVCSDPCRKTFIVNDGIVYQHLMDNVGLPERYRNRRITDWQGTSLHDGLKKWIDNPSNGLYLMGTPGTGKTSMAAALAYELRKREKTVKFQNASMLAVLANAQSMRPDNIEKFIDQFGCYEIIILDDLAKHHLSPSAKEIVYQVFSNAYDAGNIVVITSNYSFDEVSQHIDERLGSRLSEMCALVTFKGEDKRKNGAAEQQNTSQ